MDGSLSNIKQSPNEPFQEFVDRLLKAAGKIFRDPQAGVPFVKQLVYENANTACKAAISSYNAKVDLSGYICLCAEIGPSYNQGLAMTTVLKVTTVQVQAMLLQYQ